MIASFGDHLATRKNVHFFVHPPTLGINSKAIHHLMGTHRENKFLSALIPDNLGHIPATFESKCALDQVCNGVVHPVTKETITKYEK